MAFLPGGGGCGVGTGLLPLLFSTCCHEADPAGARKVALPSQMGVAGRGGMTSSASTTEK